MRRYRFGRPAALAAAGYVAVVFVFGVVTLVTGDGGILFTIVMLEARGEPVPFAWWAALPLCLAGGMRGWALWQVLRGRVTGEKTVRSRAVRWLRAALYLNVAYFVIFLFPVPSPWWVEIVGTFGRLALVPLFFSVLGGASGALRTIALVAGVLDGVTMIGGAVANGLDAQVAAQIFSFAGLGGMHWVLWMVLTLVAQARDGRWGRTTLWSGAASVALPYLVAPLIVRFYFYTTSGAYDFTWVFAISTLMDLVGVVWQARSAHDLASPPARAVPRVARPVPVRSPVHGMPFAVVAILLPLLPALANLAHGLPPWIGPRGAMESYFWPGTLGLSLLWAVIDRLVGVGGLAVLVLVAVVRRTRRLMRVTVSILFLAAAAGVVAVLPESSPTGTLEPGLRYDTQIYPDWLFASVAQSGEAISGISPLWHSAAFVAAALLLMLLYGESTPRPRPRFQFATGAVAAAVTLCVLPAGDQAAGRVTSESDCGTFDNRPGAYREPPELAFVCAARRSDALKLGKDAPDRFLVAYGRQLCGVYARNDPQELARVKRADGIEVDTLAYTLSEICPSAAAAVSDAAEQEEREALAWEAEEQRKCDEVPRHRPLIKPVSVTVQPDPLITDYGDIGAFEPDIAEAPSYEDHLPHENELLSVGPGQLIVHTHPDFVLCVTTETYTRRPPVETKGWHHVVEVGYQSVSGEITLEDPMGGTPLPNLAVRGKGHYRIRVHFAWLPWKGDKHGAQRLLIMAYPARGDDVIVHRKRTEP